MLACKMEDLIARWRWLVAALSTRRRAGKATRCLGAEDTCIFLMTGSSLGPYLH